MKLLLLVAATALVTGSCGLETVSYLSPPLGATDYLNQSQYLSLSATFNSGNYSNVDGFQGYEVYYKIYPLSTTGVFTNLAADVTRLASSPTYSYLQTLGYQRMNGSNTQPSIVPLVNLRSAATGTVTLDFTSFINTLNNANPLPALGVSGATASPPSPVPVITVPSGASSVSAFRTETNSSTTGATVYYPYFNELYGPWASSVVKGSSDLDSSVTATTEQYEIDVFLIAYAFTLEATTYSQPEPWGVLQPLNMKVPRP
jgi:hypothetical protein